MDPGKALEMCIETVGYTDHRITIGDVTGVLHTDLRWSQQFHVGAKLSVKGSQMQFYEGEIQFFALEKDGAMIFMHASEMR